MVGRGDTKNVVVVSFSKQNIDNAQISLVDEKHKILYQSPIGVNREIAIDAARLPSGAYFIIISWTDANGELIQLKQTVHLVR